MLGNSGCWGALDSRISALGSPRADGSMGAGLIGPRERYLRLSKAEWVGHSFIVLPAGGQGGMEEAAIPLQ